MKTMPPLCWLAATMLLSCGGPTSKGGAASGLPASAASPSSSNLPNWQLVLDTGPWPKSYNFQMFSISDTLWVFHPQGNWYSADGRQWQKSELPNAIGNLAFLNYVIFNDAVYGLGHFTGNIEKHQFEPVVFRTTDLRHWDTMSTNSNLPARFFYHPFVFANKFWIIGGEDQYQQYADIWNSTDGVQWTKLHDRLPFGNRSNSQVLQFNNRLYLLNNDVWSSADGIDWKQETNEIVKNETLFGYTALVFDNKIWLLGCNRNLHFTSNVLASADGKTWMDYPAPWSPRGGVAAAVHRGKIYMTGGKYGGQQAGDAGATEFLYSNDLWMMDNSTR
jgi:hypothetical protein